jgi:hypothetical protein
LRDNAPLGNPIASLITGVIDDDSVRVELLVKGSGVVAASVYPRWCYDILSDKKDIQVEDHPLYEWQQSLADSLTEEPDDRKVTFVIDKKGNQGKTWFAKNYCKYHEDAQFMEPAKKADMAYALQDDLRVLFLNITRTTEESNRDYLYSFIESVKDGMVFSPKYESRMKYYTKVHVVVMLNTEPNTTLLSEDRYNYIYLE